MNQPNHNPESLPGPASPWWETEEGREHIRREQREATADYGEHDIEIFHSKPLPPAEPDPNQTEPPF